MAPRKSLEPWGRRAAAVAVLMATLSVCDGVDAHRAKRAADIEVEINGDVTTSKYLTTTRPLPTGVLMSSAPTFVSDGTTSEYTTLVIGTVSGGRYSRIVSTAERVFYAIPRQGDKPQPTGIVSEVFSTEVHGDATTIHRTRFVRTSVGSSYGQVIERTSSLVPQLHNSQELLPTVTIGEPVQYASFAPHFTREPVAVNEIPTARRVIEGEQVIIVNDRVVVADSSLKILPTYTADGGNLVLSTPLVVVADRMSYEKTQILLNEKVNKMVKDLDLEEQKGYRVGRDFNDLKTIEILEDLALSGSGLTTVTYVGFSDFVTTIGSTVVVFMPQSAGASRIREKMSRTAAPNFVGSARVGKALLTRAPVFIPNQASVITTTRTFHNAMTTSLVHGQVDAETNGNNTDDAKSVDEDGNASAQTVLSTASTRVYNTVDLYPTGLVTSIGGTVSRDKVTTVFTTLVFGTFIKGRYAKVVKSTSSIYYLVSKTTDVQPTGVVQGTPSTLAVISNSLGSLGRAVGNGAAAQVFVGSADEAKAVLRNARLEGSIEPPSAPALFSSQADADEENSVLKTYYTTFTYFTTLSSGGSTRVKTSLSTVTRVAAEKRAPAPLTYYTTFTYFTTSQVDGQEVVSTRYVTQSEVVAATKPVIVSHTQSRKLVTKTFFTTYTYFTTSYTDGSSVVRSRLVVSSNVITSSIPNSTTSAIPNVAATKAEAPEVQYSTGLLSSHVSSVINRGITTVSSTGYFGTFVNGLYAQIIQSTAKVIDPAELTSSVAPASVHQASTVVLQSSAPGPTSISATPVPSRPNSETEPLQISSSEIFTSPAKLLSSLSSKISSSVTSSLLRIQSTNRSFLPFRTSKNRKAGGLLALLAKSGGFSVGKTTQSSPKKSEPTTTTASISSSEVHVRQITLSSVASVSSPEIKPTSSQRGLPSRSRRLFPSLRRPGRPGLRGLFRNRIQTAIAEPTEETITAAPNVEVTASSVIEEQPIDPTEDPDLNGSSEDAPEVTIEADVVATQPPRVLSFGRPRAANGTRNALPLRRRPKGGSRRGLASRFSSVTAGNSEPDKEETTSTTTTTSRTTVQAETEPPTRVTTQPAYGTSTEQPRIRLRGRGRGKGRPRGGPGRRFRRPPAVVDVTNTDVLNTEATETEISSATEQPDPSAPVQRVRVRRPGRRRRPRLGRGRRRRPASEEDLDAAGSELHGEYVLAEPLPEYEHFSEQNHFLDEAGSEVEEVVAYAVDFLPAAINVAQTGISASLSRNKRQSGFGARTRSRASQREALSHEEALDIIESGAGGHDTKPDRAQILNGRRRQVGTRRSKARSSRQSEAPRARSVSPSPTEEVKEKFTLTSQRPRGSTRFGDRGSSRSSSSSTRRAIPNSRRNRPSQGSDASSGRKISLRQRLQQAQLSGRGVSRSPHVSPPPGSTLSRDSSTRGTSTSNVRQPSIQSSSRGGSSGSITHNQRPFGSSRIRDREPPDPLPVISPTPILDDGQIIVVVNQQVAASIPVVADGRTTFKDVFTARIATSTLEANEYTVTEIGGELRTHLGQKTAVGAMGHTVITTFFIEPTQIQTAIFTPTRVRGSIISSGVYSYIQPGFTVRPEVKTVATQLQFKQSQHNNALTALLQQLLTGQQQPVSPLVPFGRGTFGAPFARPQQTFRTFSITSSYVTTVTESSFTTVPIFFQGRKTNTVIVNTATEVITVTEVITSSTLIPGQTVAPAFGLGGLGVARLGLTPQQLLLQQLLNQRPQPQLPLIQPTANIETSQPPQLEELLRQATEVSQQAQLRVPRQQVLSTSVVTIYVSGSQLGEFFKRVSTVSLDDPLEPSRIKRGQIPTAAVHATEVSAFTETDQGVLGISKDPYIFGDLDFYVMSAINEIEPDMIHLDATQTLESAKGKATQYRKEVIDVVPSFTDSPSLKTDSFLWDGPAEYAPLRREKRQATRGRARFNDNDLSFVQRYIHQPAATINAYTTFTYANTVIDEFGSTVVSSTEHVLRKLTTHNNIEFIELTRINARPSSAGSLLFGILATEADPITRTIAARGSGLAARKTQSQQPSQGIGPAHDALGIRRGTDYTPGVIGDTVSLSPLSGTSHGRTRLLVSRTKNPILEVVAERQQPFIAGVNSPISQFQPVVLETGGTAARSLSPQQGRVSPTFLNNNAIVRIDQSSDHLLTVQSNISVRAPSQLKANDANAKTNLDKRKDTNTRFLHSEDDVRKRQRGDHRRVSLRGQQKTSSIARAVSIYSLIREGEILSQDGNQRSRNNAAILSPSGGRVAARTRQRVTAPITQTDAVRINGRRGQSSRRRSSNVFKIHESQSTESAHHNDSRSRLTLSSVTNGTSRESVVQKLRDNVDQLTNRSQGNMVNPGSVIEKKKEDATETIITPSKGTSSTEFPTKLTESNIRQDEVLDETRASQRSSQLSRTHNFRRRMTDEATSVFIQPDARRTRPKARQATVVTKIVFVASDNLNDINSTTEQIEVATAEPSTIGQVRRRFRPSPRQVTATSTAVEEAKELIQHTDTLDDISYNQNDTLVTSATYAAPSSRRISPAGARLPPHTSGIHSSLNLAKGRETTIRLDEDVLQTRLSSATGNGSDINFTVTAQTSKVSDMTENSAGYSSKNLTGNQADQSDDEVDYSFQLKLISASKPLVPARRRRLLVRTRVLPGKTATTFARGVTTPADSEVEHILQRSDNPTAFSRAASTGLRRRRPSRRRVASARRISSQQSERPRTTFSQSGEASLKRQTLPGSVRGRMKTSNTDRNTAIGNKGVPPDLRRAESLVNTPSPSRDSRGRSAHARIGATSTLITSFTAQSGSSILKINTDALQSFDPDEDVVITARQIPNQSGTQSGMHNDIAAIDEDVRAHESASTSGRRSNVRIIKIQKIRRLVVDSLHVLSPATSSLTVIPTVIQSSSLLDNYNGGGTSGEAILLADRAQQKLSRRRRIKKLRKSLVLEEDGTYGIKTEEPTPVTITTRRTVRVTRTRTSGCKHPSLIPAPVTTRYVHVDNDNDNIISGTPKPIRRRQRVRVTRTRILSRTIASVVTRLSSGGPSPGTRNDNRFGLNQRVRSNTSGILGQAKRGPISETQRNKNEENNSTVKKEDAGVPGTTDDSDGQSKSHVELENGTNIQDIPITNETDLVVQNEFQEAKQKPSIQGGARSEAVLQHSDNLTAVTAHPDHRGGRQRVVQIRRLPATTAIDAFNDTIQGNANLQDERDDPVIAGTISPRTAIEDVLSIETTPTSRISSAMIIEGHSDDNGSIAGHFEDSTFIAGTTGDIFVNGLRRPGLIRRPSSGVTNRRPNSSTGVTGRRRNRLRRPNVQRQNIAPSQDASFAVEDTDINGIGQNDDEQRTVTTTESTRGPVSFRSRGRRPSRPGLGHPSSTRLQRPALRPVAAIVAKEDDRGRFDEDQEDEQRNNENVDEDTAQSSTIPPPRRPVLRLVDNHQGTPSSTTARPRTVSGRGRFAQSPTGRRGPAPLSRARPAVVQGPSRTGARALEKGRTRNDLSGQTDTTLASTSTADWEHIEQEEKKEKVEPLSFAAAIPDRSTTTNAPRSSVPFFPGLNRGTNQNRVRRPFTSRIRTATTMVPTRRPALTSALTKPDVQALVSDVNPDHGDDASELERDENVSDDLLPSNVVYHIFSTVSLIEIFGGRQTLTLPVRTSTLTTLAASDLHLVTDAPWLFDGSTKSNSGDARSSALPTIRPTLARPLSVSQTPSNYRPFAALGPSQIAPSLRRPATTTASSQRQVAATSSLIRPTAVTPSLRRPVATAPSLRRPTAGSSNLRLPNSTTTERRRPLFGRNRGTTSSVRRPDSEAVTSVDEERLLFSAAISAARHQILSNPRNVSSVQKVVSTYALTLRSDIVNVSEDIDHQGSAKVNNVTLLEGSVEVDDSNGINFVTETLVNPEIQDTSLPKAFGKFKETEDGLDLLINLLAGSSVVATPALEHSSLVPSSRPFFSAARTSVTPFTSSGTVVIIGELITSSVIDARSSIILPAKRVGFGRVVSSEDVSQVLGPSVIATADGIATKVMDNGVPVLVAGGRVPPEQVVTNGQVVLNSGTLTLPAVPLSDAMSLLPSTEIDPELLTRGTEGFNSRFYRTHTYYTTFTFLNHFNEDGKSVVVTSRETVSNVLTLPATAVAPSFTHFQTETYLKTYTYFRTTTRSNREQITSTREVVTHIVVTEAPAAPTVAPSRSLLFTKTYLSTVTLFDTTEVSGQQMIVSSTSVIKDVAVETLFLPEVRPTATRPPIRVTVAPPQRPAGWPTPAVGSSLQSVGEQDEIHVVATRTFYTTSTFYTTLLEGSATVVRTRTEVTSRVQTEKVTTRLNASHLSSLRFSLATATSPSTLALSISAARPPLLSTLVSTGPATVFVDAPSRTLGSPAPSRIVVTPSYKPIVVTPSDDPIVVTPSDKLSGVDLKAGTTPQLPPDGTKGTPVQPSPTPATPTSPPTRQTQTPSRPSPIPAPPAPTPASPTPSSARPDPIPARPSPIPAPPSPIPASPTPIPAPPDPIPAPPSPIPARPSPIPAPPDPIPAPPDPIPAPPDPIPAPPDPIPPAVPVSAAQSPATTPGTEGDISTSSSTSDLPPVAASAGLPVAQRPSVAAAATVSGGAVTTPASSSTTSPQSTAASLGNLAGSLLGLSGLAAGSLSIGSMVDTAAGLFRNVLPLAVRRDGSNGVAGGRPPPAVQVQQRNPAFIPVGGVAASVRRRQQQATSATAPGSGFLAIRGPDGKLIPLRGVPNDALPRQPPPGLGPQGGFQKPQRSGAPVRRVDQPRRPGPGGRPGALLPFRQNGRRPPRPPRPSRRQQHLARPNGFIAVFPGREERPNQHQDGDFANHSGSPPLTDGFAELGEGLVQLKRGDPSQPGQPFQIHVRPRPAQQAPPRRNLAPGRRRPAPGLSPPRLPGPGMGTPHFGQPQLEQFQVADGRQPFPSGGSQLAEFRPDESTRVHVSITTGAQTHFIDVSTPAPLRGAATALQPRPVVVVGASTLPGFGRHQFVETRRSDSPRQPAYVQAVFGDEEVGFVDEDPKFADEDTDEDQQLAASVQATFDASQLAYFDISNAGIEPDRRPAYKLETPVWPARTRHRSTTMHTIAQLEGDNRIVGTNVFADVVPFTTRPAIITVSFPHETARVAPPAPASPNSRWSVVSSTTTTPPTSTTSPETTTEMMDPTSNLPNSPVIDLELAASTERVQLPKRPHEQSSSSITGDEENDKINFIVSTSFDEATTPPPPPPRPASHTPSLTSSRRPTRLADRIRQTLLASLSSVAAEEAAASNWRVHIGSSTSIIGPDVRTLRGDPRLTREPGGARTVISGQSTVFGGLFTRPHLPVGNVHHITEIVHGNGRQPITKYITRTEQFTRTVTATETDIRFQGNVVITTTKIITSTLPPITIVSTVIGTSTQIHTLNMVTPSRVSPLTTSREVAPPPPHAPPPQHTPPPPHTLPPPHTPPLSHTPPLPHIPPPSATPDEIFIAGVLVPDSIDLGDVRKGVSDDNEINRVIINPGGGQQIVVEQSEAVTTLCERPCLPDIFEMCRRVDGVHRCACRPGYSRAREHDPCAPTLTYRLQVVLDRVNDIPLWYRPPFGDPDSAEFGQMARLTQDGLSEALAATSLSDRLHTTQLMAFKRPRTIGEHGRPRQHGLLAELMVQLSDRHGLPMDKAYLKQMVEASLRSSNYSLGGQQVVVSHLTDAITALDFDECEDADDNDCHTHAFCYNLVGSFTCSCRDGMIDIDITNSPGRACSAESAGCVECSYSGECYTRDDGGTRCRCHRWYAGNRCQINLRVLLIALVTVGAVLSLMLCACCFLCCRHKSRTHAAPPLVFTGPAGFLRHRGTRLHNPVMERRAMLESGSDTSATSPPRPAPAPLGNKRAPAPAPLPSMERRSRLSGRTTSSSQEERSMVSTAVRPPVFIPRAKHKHPRPISTASSTVRVGADGSADLSNSQNRLLSVLEAGPRGRTRTGTCTSQRTSRSVSSGRRCRNEVSHLPTGRSHSSDHLSHSADSLADPAEYGSHAFFRERTMSEARSFDETTIRPSVRSMRGFSTQCSQLSSRPLSSNLYTYDHHTMAERDAASTFVMPETQLFRPAADSDVQSDFSLADDFPQIHRSGRSSRPSSTVSSRHGHR